MAHFQVVLYPDAYLSARGSELGGSYVSGGVIQIESVHDVKGACDKKFNVSGATNGLVNILGKYVNIFSGATMKLY